jgi:ectoine hydroxylase-related dioxygenase (phytanoyl-CoA dioxygenase family)
LAKKLNLKETAEQILDSKVKLIRIDHFWSPQSNNPVIEWHVDNAYSGRKDIKVFNKPDKQAIKFFFYLTNVSSDNGCLAYIPFSHKIAYALKKGIYERYIEYQPYWSLFDFRKIILKKENYNYIKKLVDEKIIIDFLNTSELILSKKIDECLFDHKINKGGALIFDEAGAHKGSRTISNDRMVLRFFYQRS